MTGIYCTVQLERVICSPHGTLWSYVFREMKKERVVLILSQAMLHALWKVMRGGGGLKDSWRGFGVRVEILWVKYLGSFRAKCKKDSLAKEMKATGEPHQRVPGVVRHEDGGAGNTKNSVPDYVGSAALCRLIVQWGFDDLFRCKGESVAVIDIYFFHQIFSSRVPRSFDLWRILERQRGQLQVYGLCWPIYVI